MVDDDINLKDQLDIAEDRITIGAVARLSEQKNPVEILEVAGRLQQKGFAVTAVLIGGGDLREECQKYAKEQGIDARIPGFCEDALSLLSGLDIFLLTSRFEGLPLTVLEAMHLGIPIVSYDIGGVGEAVVDGETGYIVDQMDTEAFVGLTEKLVKDDRLRKDFGRDGKKLARSKFTEKRMAQEYNQVYSEIYSK
ncbi:glycosyltransferase [Halorubellus sp. PRR65]|uniref:glycosyltransferase n=1 Tax=Halorubellus sp. PRR65 TaxID=3098148 RepID=UPI002B25829E|nr:glycosyltransferase [Halorubellus sp. PRR65]